MLMRVVILVAGIALAATLGTNFLALSTGSERAEVASVERTKSSPSKSTAPESDSRQIALRADPSGHVIVDSVINGMTVQMVVDTGATWVTLSEETAHRLGFRLGPSDFTILVSTANGITGAAPIALADIKVGGIHLRNVDAMVVPGNALGVDLLGMSFLNRLTKFQLGGGQLVLVQ